MRGEYINGDCMDYLPQYEDNHFDLAIVDPPYGIGDITQTTNKHISYNNFNWNNEIPSENYFNHLIRVSRNQIIWGINYYPRIKAKGRLIHDKTGGGKRQQLKELSDADIASHSFGVNIKIFHYLWQGNVQGNTINWKNTGIDARIHPTQKPIALYKWLLTNYANEGDLILDTHVGSASSLIACEDMKFDYVGFELDEEYYKDSMKRLQDHVKQLMLF